MAKSQRKNVRITNSAISKNMYSFLGRLISLSYKGEHTIFPNSINAIKNEMYTVFWKNNPSKNMCENNKDSGRAII